MRVWDVPSSELCRNHLLGEHAELHAIWAVLTRRLKGYSRHPETQRWRGKLRALYLRHEKQVAEMKRRGFSHNSPLDRRLARGSARQTVLLQSVREQRAILRGKRCSCGKGLTPVTARVRARTAN